MSSVSDLVRLPNASGDHYAGDGIKTGEVIANNFDQILKMIAKLESEASDDTTKKDDCYKELTESNAKKDDNKAELEKGIAEDPDSDQGPQRALRQS